jgi:hypothetical protein
MFTVHYSNPAKYVENEFKKIVTPANIRRMIFFDKNGTETTLKDRSGNAKDATLSLSASSLNPDVVGRAKILNFNATGDYWDFADADDLSFGNGSADSAMSIVTCIIPNTTTTQILCGKRDLTTGNTKNEYALQFGPLNKLYFNFYDNSEASSIGRVTDSFASDVGVCCVYTGTYSGNGNSSGVQIYRNETKADKSDDNAGSYVAMENLGAKVASYRTKTDGTKERITSAKYVFLAILSIELTQEQVTEISELLIRYAGGVI